MRRLFLLLIPLLGSCEGEAERAVRRGMLDPDAAQFREVRRCSGDPTIWRGEVNGKNTFGAYTGFKPFFFSDGSTAYTGDPGFMVLLDRCYSDLKSDEAKIATTAGPSSTQPIASPAPTEMSKPKPAIKPAANSAIDPSEGEERPGHPNLVSEERCWASYCPCDRSDPDFGGPDQFICDRMRHGLPVDEEILSSSSGMRDARRQLREFQAENGRF